MTDHVIETAPDIAGYAAANRLGNKFPKHHLPRDCLYRRARCS
jgi:hypothetical protein